MRKTTIVCALAFSMFGAMSASISHGTVGFTSAAAQQVVVTDTHIARLRSVLRLTPEQEIYWRPLEAALRGAATPVDTEEAGFYQRVKARLRTYVVNARAAQRISYAAQPLIASLSEEQKQAGMAYLRAVGVGSLF